VLPFDVPSQFVLTVVFGLASIVLTVGVPVLWLEYLARTNQSVELRAPVSLRDRRERL
jgi:hypothetical protein